MKKFYLTLAAAVLANAAIMAQDFSNKNILTQATGTPQDFVVAGYGIYPSGMDLMELEYDAYASEIYFDEEAGKAYVFNLMTHAQADSYLVGDYDKAAGRITFTFPQPYCNYEYEDGSSHLLYAAVMRSTGTSYSPIPKQKMDLTLENGVWIMDLPTSDAILGLCDDQGQYYYYGEHSLRYSEMTEKSLGSIPVDFEDKTWTVYFDGDGHEMTVAFDGDDIYMRGIFNQFPYAWIKGHIDGEDVTFEPFQLLGLLDEGYYAWACVGDINYDNPGTYLINGTIRMKINADRTALTCNQKVLLNSSKKLSRVAQEMSKPEFAKGSAITGSFEPKMPELYYFYPKVGMWGTTWIEFTCPRISIDNVLLDTDKLYYKVYVDGEEYIFERDENEYYNLPSAYMVEIPWEFDDNWDFKSLGGGKRYVRLRGAGIETIGVQSIYRDGEKEYVSEVKHLTPEEISINAVDAVETEKTVAAEWLMDMSGLRVNNDARGILVKTTLYSDGSRKTEKIVR